MIYTKLTVKAMNIAYNAHHGQVDKSGVPYIFHPYHLAEQMTDELSVCVALLHDVVEDTDISIDFIEREFPKEVAEAVKLLTHNENQDYFDYIINIKENPIAKAVKIADLTHNSDQSRITDKNFINTDKMKNLKEKYKKALTILVN